MKQNILNIINENCMFLKKHIDNILLEKNEIFCTFLVSPNNQNHFEQEKQILTKKLKKTYPSYNIYINAIKTKSFQKQSFSNIKKIIAIASGKGGVGKSTIAVNLAYTLETLGKKVGILDGDIYGPSIDASLQGKVIQSTSSAFPVYAKNNIKYISVANFLPNKNDAVLMKSPMIIKLFNQLLNDTPWDYLDYLIIDLPPGTGDLHIHLMLKYVVDGIIMVCTPQKIALIDAIKAINMYNKLNAPIVGVIENMSSFSCPKCGEISSIFSSNGVLNITKEYNLKMLGNIPINISLRECLDEGKNFIALNQNHPITKNFLNIGNSLLLNNSLK